MTKKIIDWLEKNNVPLFGNYFGAKPGEQLIFWATLIGLIVGICSGLYFASDQKEAAANLNARTKNAEISAQLMQELDTCRNTLVSAVQNESNLVSIKASLSALRLCRGQIGVSLAGLNALIGKLNFDGGNEDYRAILAVDDNALRLIKKIRSAPNLDLSTQTKLLDEIFDFIGTDNDTASAITIYGLEEKLKRSGKAQIN